jgi:hypothetical protein
MTHPTGTTVVSGIYGRNQVAGSHACSIATTRKSCCGLNGRRSSVSWQYQITYAAARPMHGQRGLFEQEHDDAEQRSVCR